MPAPFDPAAPPAGVALVATDLDGTFLDPLVRVSARTAAASRAAVAAGIHVVPVTARPPHATYPFARAAGLTGLGVCLNGAAIVDLGAERVLEAHALDGAVAQRIVRAARRQVEGIVFASDTPTRFEHEPGFLTAAEDDWEEEVLAVDDVVEGLAGDVLKLIARADGWSADALRTVLEQLVGEGAHVTSSNALWVELSAPGVTKGLGVERVCTKLGIPLSAVVACGDNLNDLAMLAVAGTSCAMASGHHLVLATADVVLPGHGEDGVAQLLESLAAHR